MFGLSYPEAQTDTWMSYDTEIQLETSDDYIPIHERKWRDIIANEHSHSYKWETQISKAVSKLVRHECRDIETDGAIHWKLMLPKLVITFRKGGSRDFTDRDWINYMWKGSSRTRFQYGQNSRGKLLYIRAIQGHSGGETSEPEMIGHVCVPISWKEFVFHRGCSFDLKSLLGAVLIAGGRAGRETRHTVFFTP